MKLYQLNATPVVGRKATFVGFANGGALPPTFVECEKGDDATISSVKINSLLDDDRPGGAELHLHVSLPRQQPGEGDDE